MKNKTFEFFAIKLLILLIVDVVLVLFYMVLGAVFNITVMHELLGGIGSFTLQCGIVFAFFIIYSARRAYKFKIDQGTDKSELPQFALREGAIYLIFMLPFFIAVLILKSDIVTASWARYIYAPHMVMYVATGNAVVGFGTPVIIYTAAVTAARSAALSHPKVKDEKPL